MFKKIFFATLSVLLSSYLNVNGQDLDKSINKAIQKTLNEMPDCEYILFSDRYYKLNLQNIITKKKYVLTELDSIMRKISFQRYKLEEIQNHAVNTITELLVN